MKRIMLMIVAALCLFMTVAAQEEGRKKVAVVLSGGGAKGMAHIGVLKVLEKAGIPVDIITGTSMGSIVGGLYATGIDATTLDSLVRRQDWSFILSDKEDLKHQSLKEREKQNTYILSKSFRYKGKGSSEGGGLIGGKNLDVLFTNLLGEYSDSIDFNQLPIPFACVATNIVDNTEHVFHRGRLKGAMRASMAIPGVFSPVRLGGMVLVDGGLRNNFPVDVAKEMGADYVIGVTVQADDRKADELRSTGNILMQIVDVNCKNKYEENLRLTDIPIRVDVHGYGSASFNAAAIDTLIRRGEEAAMKHWDEIVALRDSLGLTQEKTQNLPRSYELRMPLPNNHQHKIMSFRFRNMTENDEKFIRAKFNLKEGMTIDDNKANLITTSIRMDLFYKQAIFRFERLEGDKDHGENLLFIAGEKSTNDVNLGIRFDNEETVALQVNSHFPLRAELPLDLDMTVRLGKRNMGRLDLTFKPRYFFRHSVSYVFRRNDIDVYEKGNKAYNLTYSQHTASFTVIDFDVRNFNICIGPQWDYYHLSALLVNQSKLGIEKPVKDDHYFNYCAQVMYNSENDWHFPTKGAKFVGKFAYHTDNFLKMDDKVGPREVAAMWRMSFPLNKVLTLQPLLYGRIIDGPSLPIFLRNALGGEWFGHYVEHQSPFPGVRHIELIGDKFLAAQVQAQMHLSKNNIMLFRLAAAQQADEFDHMLKSHLLFGTSLSYFYNTMFGPIGGVLGYSNKSKDVYIFVNFGFAF